MPSKRAEKIDSKEKLFHSVMKVMTVLESSLNRNNIKSVIKSGLFL